MANVKTYYKSKSGNTYLSKNFQVKEFRCKDGTDKMLIDTEMVYILQKIRELARKAVTINSAYRTTSWNKKQNGASNSYHLYGRAFDIWSNGLSNDNICKIANTFGLLGIGRYANFVHIDSRTKNKWHKDCRTNKYVTFGKYTIPFIGVNIKNGSKSNDVGVVQFKLNSLGYNCGTVDGICGTKTINAIRAFQKAKGLAVDGICGKNTWAKLFN